MSFVTTDSNADLGTAIVTGGASGLGRAFALALAQCGHDVAILDLADASDTAAEVSAFGRLVHTEIGDASDATAVTTFATHVRERLSPVRVVVNNAGISPYASFDDTTIELFQRVLRVNLDSMFLVTSEFVSDLRNHGHGRIVNLASSVCWDAQARDMSAYITSKMAVVGFTRALASELGASHITVNAIAPGITLTPDILSRVPAERLEVYRQRQAIPRLADPDDIAAALLFLISESASQVTGTVVPVNGGRVMW